MARTQTPKTISKRVDPAYVIKPRRTTRQRWLLSLVAMAIALSCWLVYALRGRQTIYNPGPVSNAHAFFEADCAKCHRSSSDGHFSRTVSDAACLTCHDGPVHHASQNRLISTDGVTSKNCATCHTEHRGHAALAAASNAHCLQCHDNLDAATLSGQRTGIKNAIASFTPADHPRFGRALRENPADDKSPLADHLTHIKFNHKLHLDPSRSPGITRCDICHTTSDPSPLARDNPTVDDKLPATTVHDRPASAANSTDRRYMQPVNYERHCASCHKLTVAQAGEAPNFLNIEVAHVKMDIVQQQLAALPALYSAALAKDPQREKKLTITKKVRNKVTETKITEQEWSQAQIEKLQSGDIADWLASPRATNHPDLKKLLTPTGDPAAPPTLSPEEQRSLYVAYATGNSCNKCHDLQGTPPGSKAPETSTTQPSTTQPAALPTVFGTKPTNLPTSPRRWFTSSQFDHDKHRTENLTCTTCHAAALTSADTAEILLPNIESCTTCHHDPNASGRGVAADCTSCHLYHDRTKERVTAAFK